MNINRSGSTASFHSGSKYVESTNKAKLIVPDLWCKVTGEATMEDDPSCDTDLNKAYIPSNIQTQQEYVKQAKDFLKSRNLQKRIDEPNADIRMIFSSLYNCFDDLVFDNTANFVIQKLCDRSTPEMFDKMMDFFLKDVHRVVDHPIACRVLQKFIETAPKKNVESLFNALRPGLMNLCMSQNGNHIVQRFVTLLPDKLDDIVHCILPDVISLAIDNCGCRIVQRLFEKYKISELRPIVDAVIKEPVELATNQYGNYVVQYILNSKEKEYVTELIQKFSGRFYEFSVHKFASNVIEKCIRGASEEERMMIFEEVIGPENSFEKKRILKMIEDQFGNYVIQRIIEYGSAEQKRVIRAVVTENYEELKEKQYAKYVFQCLDKKST